MKHKKTLKNIENVKKKKTLENTKTFKIICVSFSYGTKRKAATTNVKRSARSTGFTLFLSSRFIAFRMCMFGSHHSTEYLIEIVTCNSGDRHSRNDPAWCCSSITAGRNFDVWVLRSASALAQTVIACDLSAHMCCHPCWVQLATSENTNQKF